MAAGNTESELDTIPEEVEEKNGSKLTLISDASTKSTPNSSGSDCTFGTELSETVTQ